MERLKIWQSLIICLVAEIIVFVLGTVFVHPLPIMNLNDRLMAFALYELSCVMGIVSASIYGLLDQKDTSKVNRFEIIITVLIVGIPFPIWNIALLLVAIFTLILIVLDLKNPSKNMRDPL